MPVLVSSLALRAAAVLFLTSCACVPGAGAQELGIPQASGAATSAPAQGGLAGEVAYLAAVVSGVNACEY